MTIGVVIMSSLLNYGLIILFALGFYYVLFSYLTEPVG
jgi:hypothetical protein